MLKTRYFTFNFFFKGGVKLGMPVYVCDCTIGEMETKLF